MKAANQKQKQTAEQKLQGFRALNAERIACLQHDLANVPPGLKGTHWETDRQRDLDAALAWRERNPVPPAPKRTAPAGSPPLLRLNTDKAPPRPRRLKAGQRVINRLDSVLPTPPPEIARVKRTRSMRLPVKAPVGKVTVNFLNPDGSLWERIHLDERIWNAAERQAERDGVTMEEIFERAVMAAFEKVKKGGAL